MANKPKIRFKGFDDAWEQRKLSELASMHARIGWQNLRTSEFLDVGDYMLITGTDFEDGKVNYSTCHYVEKERYDQDKNIQIKNGSILITKDGTLGKVAYVEGLSMPATLNAGVFNVEIKNKNETDGRYLFQFLKAPFLMDYVAQKATGGTIKHLNQNILVDFPISSPSKEEQTKIGEYFSSIDHLITLHQRKCDQMNELKKYMLTKMFPQNGSKVPEIRFDGYTDDWEQRKLGEVAEFSKGSGYSKGDLVEYGTPIILYGRLYTNYETRISDVDTFVEAKVGSVYSKGGEVVVPASGETAEDIARAATVDKSGILLGGDLNIVMPNKDINSSFLAISISSGNPQRELAKKAQGKSVVHIHNEEIKNLVLPFPIKDEQNKIASYFCQLDNLITLHQHKCNELREIKKYMLKNMFI
ncbi:MAG: restriction endonuclease subunit S [Coprococcus sp.]